MKKLFLLLLSGGIMMTACKKEEKYSNIYSYKQVKSLEMKPRIKFKHTGTNPQDPPCEQPLGICIIFSIKAGYGNVTDEERKEGIGTANLFLLDENQLKLVPDTRFSYENNTIELEGNNIVDKEVANSLKCSELELLKGIYKVNSKEGKYGSVIVNVNTKP